MLELLTDCLAAYRLTRLVSADTITKPLRERVIVALYARKGLELDPSLGDISEYAMEDPEAPMLADLITCRFCAGMWVAFGVVAARRYLPGWSIVARALSLSSAAALLAALED